MGQFLDSNLSSIVVLDVQFTCRSARFYGILLLFLSLTGKVHQGFDIVSF